MDTDFVKAVKGSKFHYFAFRLMYSHQLTSKTILL